MKTTSPNKIDNNIIHVFFLNSQRPNIQFGDAVRIRPAVSKPINFTGRSIWHPAVEILCFVHNVSILFGMKINLLAVAVFVLVVSRLLLVSAVIMAIVFGGWW